jgi:hypothetical protein
MIDYEKLKIAHELAADTVEYYFEAVFGIKGSPDYALFNASGKRIGEFDTEDGLLEMLQELTQPGPKYKVDAAVWMLNHEHKPEQYIVFEDLFDIDSYSYTLHNDNLKWREESELHPTKAALIEAQIKYWSNMREEKPQERQYHHPRQYADALISGLCAPQVGTTGCQHESDGCSYVTSNQSQMHSKRCIKCGVFYICW